MFLQTQLSTKTKINKYLNVINDKTCTSIKALYVDIDNVKVV